MVNNFTRSSTSGSQIGASVVQSRRTELNEPVISAIEPDWSREAPKCFWDPFPRLLRTIRRYTYWDNRPGLLSKLMKRRWSIAHIFWSLVTQADIPVDCKIEGGLMCMHPSGVVLHPDARIGPNCFLGPHVVIGVSSGSGVPSIGGNVNLGAGACVLGGVLVGENTMIGANAVVISDIPPNSTAVGVPARCLQASSQ